MSNNDHTGVAALMGRWDMRSRDGLHSERGTWRQAIEELREATGVVAGVGYDLTVVTGERVEAAANAMCAHRGHPSGRTSACETCRSLAEVALAAASGETT